jgi:hypothetical protein
MPQTPAASKKQAKLAAFAASAGEVEFSSIAGYSESAVKGRQKR